MKTISSSPKSSRAWNVLAQISFSFLCLASVPAAVVYSNDFESGSSSTIAGFNVTNPDYAGVDVGTNYSLYPGKTDKFGYFGQAFGKYIFTDNGVAGGLGADLSLTDDYSFAIDLGHRGDGNFSTTVSGFKFMVRNDENTAWVTLNVGAPATYTWTGTAPATAGTFSTNTFSLSSSVINANYSQYDGNALRLEIYLVSGGNGSSGQVHLDNLNLSTTTVPEPSTMAMLGLGLLIVVGNRRRTQALKI